MEHDHEWLQKEAETRGYDRRGDFNRGLIELVAKRYAKHMFDVGMLKGLDMFLRSNHERITTDEGPAWMVFEGQQVTLIYHTGEFIKELKKEARRHEQLSRHKDV